MNTSTDGSGMNEKQHARQLDRAPIAWTVVIIVLFAILRALGWS